MNCTSVTATCVPQTDIFLIFPKVIPNRLICLTLRIMAQRPLSPRPADSLIFAQATAANPADLGDGTDRIGGQTVLVYPTFQGVAEFRGERLQLICGRRPILGQFKSAQVVFSG